MSETIISVFFFDSLVNVFKPTEQDLWAFSIYYNKDIEEVSINSCDPKHATSLLALRTGKLRALENHVLRSRDILCLTLYPSDLVLMQSDEAIKRFGKAKDMEAANFYPNKQERLEMIQEAKAQGIVERRSFVLSDIDANRFEGEVSCELIEIDESTRLLLERFKPLDVHDLINP